MAKTNQSIYDSLLNQMPNLGRLLFNNNYINPKVSSNLFSIWKKSNKTNSDTFKRPPNLSIYEIKDMVKAGLVRTIGENIELTKKGKDVIKVMILGDDRSVFTRDNTIIDYNEALANTKNLKTAKGKNLKVASNTIKNRNWYKKAKTKDKQNKECLTSCSVKEAQRARYKGQLQGDEARGFGDSSKEYFDSRAQELSEEIATMRSLFIRSFKGDEQAKNLIDDYIQQLKERGFSKNVIEKEIISPAMYKLRI